MPSPLAVVTAITGLLLVFSMSMVYMLPTVPAWNSLATPVGFFTTTLLFGNVAVGAAFMSVIMRRAKKGAAESEGTAIVRAAMKSMAVWVIVLVGVSFVTLPLYAMSLATQGGTAAESAALITGAGSGWVLASRLVLLFIGPGRPHAVPYESVYRGKEGLLFEESTFAVRRAYEAFGLVVPNLNREPDDHIALEFSFLAHLCLRALDALDAGDDLKVDQCLAGEQAFLDDHVLQWMPTMLEAMLAQAETPFYRAFAQLAQGVLADAKLVD